MLTRTARVAWLIAAVAAAVTAVAPGPISAQESAPDERPNIIVIVTDDQRVDTMSIMRRTRRWLIERGATFTNAFATTPLCCPSRATIFSGQYVHNHGVESNLEATDLDTETTMQARLQGAGYLTGFAGKYLNGWPVSQRPPHFNRVAMRAAGANYTNIQWNMQGKVVMKSEYEADTLKRKTTQFLSSFELQDDRPWFLYVAPIAPHNPADPEPKYRDARVPPWPSTPAMHEDDLSDKPLFIQESPSRGGRGVLKMIRKQHRTLLSVDDMIHRMMMKLGDLGERRRTLILFLSDNGYMWRDHGITGKNLPYLPSSQIPMIMTWPGVVPPGSSDARLAGNVDIAPTVLDAAGIEVGNEMDGRSLLDPGWLRDRLLLENRRFVHPAWASLVSPEYQYIEWDEPEDVGTIPEYYDLLTDPWQLRNAFGDADPTNDPPVAALALQLEDDRDCKGTTQEPGGPSPCP